MGSDTILPTRVLRMALLGDAASSGAMGLLLAGGAGALSAPLGLPETLLRAAGLVLLPWAGWVALLGNAASVARNALRAVVAVNIVWVIDSLLLLGFARWLGLAPTAFGVAFVLMQAAAVAGFACVQAAALRRAQKPA